MCGAFIKKYLQWAIKQSAIKLGMSSFFCLNFKNFA